MGVGVGVEANAEGATLCVMEIQLNHCVKNTYCTVIGLVPQVLSLYDLECKSRLYLLRRRNHGGRESNAMNLLIHFFVAMRKV